MNQDEIARRMVEDRQIKPARAEALRLLIDGPRPALLLLDINLPSDWMAGASAGSKAKAGTWSGTASGGSGATPGHWRIYNNQTTKDNTTCIAQGSANIGSGDMNFDGTITSGQTVTVNSFTLNDNNP